MAKAKRLEELMNEFFSFRRSDPIKTQHASAADFDEFSDAHMGSGEGAQFYGVGHYTSQGDPTHKQYMEQARGYPTNQLGRRPEGGKYAMSYDVGLHVDPERVLDLDMPVEAEMLDLLEGRGGRVKQRRWTQYSKEDQAKIKRYADAEASYESAGFPDDFPELDDAEAALDEVEGNVWGAIDEYKRDAFDDFASMNKKEGQFSKEKFLRGIQHYTKGEEPTNKNLVNYLDKQLGSDTSTSIAQGRALMKEIGIQAYKHDDYGQRGAGGGDLHNYITLYPELMEIVRKEKGNITLPMLATLAASGVALPPAANKLLKKREKQLANELLGGILTGAASGAVGGLSDILDRASGRSSPNPDLGIEIAGKGADKLEDIQNSILEWADEQGWNDKGAQAIGELIAPGI